VLTQGGKTLDEALAAGEPVQFQPAAAATPDPAAVDPAAAPAAVDPTKKASRSRLPFAREAGGNNEEGTSDDFNGGSAFGGKIAPDVLRALYHADPDGMETQPTQADYDDFHDWVVRQYGEATFLAYASGEEMDHFASRKSSRQIIPGWPVFWLKTASGESLCSERTGAILGSYRRDGGVFVWRTDDISGAARTTDSARTFVERAVRSFNYTAGRER